VEKLRNFRFRLTSTQFPAGATAQMAQLADETIAKMKSALDDDLNVAEAQAAIFDMLRKTNTALDAAAAGQNNFRQDDVRPLLGALEKFDEIFGVLKDDDLPKMKAILDWAKAEGREKEISPGLMDLAGSAQLSDQQVNQKLAEMEAARKSRNFKTSDTLRSELTEAGIIVENTKEGVRWRRK
jgi:cysteinyl-tRNA synthetase